DPPRGSEPGVRLRDLDGETDGIQPAERYVQRRFAVAADDPDAAQAGADHRDVAAAADRTAVGAVVLFIRMSHGSPPAPQENLNAFMRRVACQATHTAPGGSATGGRILGRCLPCTARTITCGRPRTSPGRRNGSSSPTRCRSRR